MTPKYISRAVTIPEGDDVFVTQLLAEAIKQGPNTDWKNMFQFIRLNLQGRVASSEDEDLIKLQGKIEMVGEFEQFIEKIISKKV